MKNNDQYINEHICTFVEFFDDQIKKIYESSIAKKIKKLCYFSILDTLSHCPFPNINANRNRKSILLFIDKFSNWEDKNRVSIIQLYLCLDEKLNNNEKKISKIYQYTHNKISSLNPEDGGIIYSSGIDPDFDDFINEINNDKEKKLIKRNLLKELLYDYRNRLVHEFRESGYAIEFDKEHSDVFYQCFLNIPPQIVFSVSFFKILCENTLKELEKYLKAKKINPYDKYEFSEILIRKKDLDKLWNDN